MVIVNGRDLENLLYNWLEVILIKLTKDAVVFSHFDVKINMVDNKYVLRSLSKGEELDLKKHKPKTEVKAVTYHMMQIKEERGQVSVRFLLDI